MATERADARRNRARLLDAARDVFRQGGATVQLADVARAAGVGVGTVHRHFPTREALLETLAREHFADLIEIAGRAATIEDPFEAVGLLLRGLLDAQLGQHGMAAVLTAAVDVEAATTEAKVRLDAAVAVVLARAQQTHRVRPEVSAADLRRLVAGVELAQDRRDPAARDHAYLQLTIILDGLRSGVGG
jgi:AcrR family transcriptional regulator